jgi:serine/threonine protein kinase
MSHHHHLALVLSDYAIIAISLSFFLIIMSILIFFCYKNRRKSSSPCATADDTSVTALLRVSPFPMTDLEAATDGFHHSRLIGKGHLGTVYKADSTAPTTGRSVAIKRLHPHLVLGHPGPTFSLAIKSLSFVASHPNVVPVLGFAEAPGERIIIYEYVPIKTLETFMYGIGSDGGQLMRHLSWRTRVKIATGIACGVKHLHTSTTLGIVHGCLKPCNVFVDKDYIAKISDYGLGFLLEGEEEKRGMDGYVDEEGYDLCIENDVYAFGVIILEMLSGRKSEGGRLVEWALPLIRVSRVEEVLDKRLAFPLVEMRVLARMAKVASACVGNSRGYRLTMAEVVAIFNRLEMELCADSS